MNPLVVSLVVDEAAQARFERERAEYFPAGRTQVGAHVTLFHAVPAALRDEVEHDLRSQAGERFDVRVAEQRSLGRGVAYFLDSPELARRHRALQQAWWPQLTRQDQQAFRPHVTVQNKVTPETARRTLAELQRGFVPFDVRAEGFALWRYDGGPWTHLLDVPFPSP